MDFLLENWKIIVSFLAGFALAAVPVRIAAWWRRGAALRKGRLGEKMVSKQLGRLPGREFIILNDLMLPASNGRTSQIDHVVISTRGIYVVETKSHAGRISGQETSQYWQQHLSSQTRSFYNPLLQNKSHLRALRRLLPKADKSLFSAATVFTEAWRLDIKADDIIIERSLLPDRHIRRTLIPAERRPRRWWMPWRREVRLDEHTFVCRLEDLNAELRRRPRVIGRRSLRPIADAIIAGNIAGRSQRKEHTALVRSASQSSSEKIAKGVCPRCGGQLTVRESDRGPFAACTRYPGCRFTCSIDRLHH